MAEITKTPIISISTGEAVKNVKELKDNIKALKEQLDSTETSTADYANIVKQLSQNQAALRNVMNGVNSTFTDSITAAQGLGTSYNSLVQQLKQATQEWRVIPKYLNDADQAAGKVNQAWTDAAKKVYDLRTELKSMDADTNSFVRNVGNYKSALDGFSGTMGKVKQVGGDMVNGLSAAASTLSLLGINTDGLSDSMKNLRIVVAAVQGAKGFAGMISNLRNYFKAGKQAVQVTQQQTTALQGEAAAQTAANVATNAGTVAMNGLQKALIATGIGALVVALGMLVAHFEDIVKWVGKVGERMGLWKIETDKAKEANEKLKNSLETQNRAFENQAKIMRAQGATNKSILLQKKELIKSQINETKAAIAAAEARIKQLEADHRWWKFWQGTKGKVEKELENIKEWNESLKELTNSLEDINTDIKVEDITSARKTAEKAAEDAAKKSAELLKKAQEVANAGAKVATAAIQKQETELEKLTREYNENVKAIKEAIAAAEKYSGVTANVEELKKGLTALEQEYYKNNFEANAAEYAKNQLRTLEQQYEAQKEYEKIYGDVLNLDSYRAEQLGKISAAEEQNIELLKAEQKWLRGNIELTESALTALVSVSPEDITKEFGEPLATAIIMYFQKGKEIKNAGLEAAKTMVVGFEEGFNNLISEGFYNGADEVASKMIMDYFKKFKEILGGDEGLSAFSEYVSKNFDEAMAKAMLDDQWFMGFSKSKLKDFVSIIDMLVSPADIAELERRIEELNNLEGRSFEQDQELAALEEQLQKKKLARWNAYYTQLGKYIDNYGKSTANLLDNVADAWDALLQAQVKTGKKSQEDAERSFNKLKILQYTSAIINTASAVVSALADPTVPSYYVKAINAAAALAAGTAQVIKIANTDFSGTASAAGGETPRLVQQAPAIQYTVGVNEADYAAAQAQNPIRAYVVDKDLAEGLDEYNRKEGETTF